MTEISGAHGQLRVNAAGRSWVLERPADLESLWQAMDEDDPKAEEHIPYWVELWPATLALCDWLARQDLPEKGAWTSAAGWDFRRWWRPALARRWWVWTANSTPCTLQTGTPA
jgi:hypothetical protein